jgi:hypothetical protein
MDLLENYIKSYLIKESINMEDSKKIQRAISKLSQSLSSNNLDLLNLDFNERLLYILRVANQTVKLREENSENSSEKTVIAYDTDKKVKNLGLGFNLIDSLKEKSWNKKNGGVHKKKIVKLIRSLEKVNKRKYKEKIKILKDALLLKKSIDAAGLILVGAGIYRAGLVIPEVENIIIKIGLSEKGREDSRNEIEFSKGAGASRLDHIKNFPTIYDHSPNGSWYAIEKVMMIDRNVFTNISQSTNPKIAKEVLNDIKYQLPETFKFLSSISKSLEKAGKNLLINVKNLEKNNDDILKIFTWYLGTLFSKSKGYSTAHDEVLQNAIKDTSKISKTKSLVKNKTTQQAGDFTIEIPDTEGFDSASTPLQRSKNESYIRFLKESSSPESVISFKIMSEKLDVFLTKIIKQYVSKKNIELLKDVKSEDDIGFDSTFIAKSSMSSNKTNNNAYSNIDNLKMFIVKDILNKSAINKMIDEIGSMFDQAVVTNIYDLHIGNMGFKKNEKDKWMLIFTDIDTESIK